MIRITICDDDVEICEYIKALLLAKYEEEVSIFLYSSAEELKSDYTKKERNIADILLMDIDLHGVNGIDVAAAIQEQFSEVKVIFITGHIEYCTEIFRANPNNFLMKPIEAEALYGAIERAGKQILEEIKDCFVVTCKGSVFKVKARDIFYLESEKRTVILHSRGEDWTVYRKLDDVQKELPDYFLRCHQSYLVNMNEIKSLMPLRLKLFNGAEIPISRPKYKEAKETFLRFLGQDIMDE